MWVKGETLFPFNMSVSLDLLLINILEAQGLNTIYTLINRQGFEHREWMGGWVNWILFPRGRLLPSSAQKSTKRGVHTTG